MNQVSYNWSDFRGGQCLLLNGDCQDVLKTIDLNNCVFVSDPPFNIGYHYNGYSDRMKQEDYLRLMTDVFLSNTPSVIIHYPEDIYSFAVHANKVPTRVVSWVYNSNTRKQHRDIAFFGITPDFKKVTQPYKNPTDKRIQKLIESGKTGCALYDWWEINQVKNVSKDKSAHPCQMPLEVMKRVVGILPDDLTIVDPFMGSGTTGLACKELGRNFIGIELIPEYFEICKQKLS